MAYIYRTRGTCSRQIFVELDGDVIKKVEFVGGCDGNLTGIAKIVEGMTVEQVAGKLAGTKCGPRPTSCPDQLAIAVREAYRSAQAKQ